MLSCGLCGEDQAGMAFFRGHNIKDWPHISCMPLNVSTSPIRQNVFSVALEYLCKGYRISFHQVQCSLINLISLLTKREESRFIWPRGYTSLFIFLSSPSLAGLLKVNEYRFSLNEECEPRRQQYSTNRTACVCVCVCVYLLEILPCKLEGGCNIWQWEESKPGCC